MKLNAVPVTKTVLPHQLAWLRRSELDEKAGGYEVWEKPNGEFYVHDPTQGALLLVKLG